MPDMESLDISNAAVIGAGSWGTTVANLLAENVARVTLWARDPEVVHSIGGSGVNQRFLPELKLRGNVRPTNSYEEAFVSARLILWAIPVQHTRGRLRDCASYIAPDAIFINLSKGLEERTLYRPSQIILDVCPSLHTVGTLGGPNIAAEVARGMSTEASLAVLNHWKVRGLERLLTTPTFRVALSPDLVALEVAGALKNVVAIAAGICDGLGAGNNLKSAIVARGFEEMCVVGRELGANPNSFTGSFGLGDLMATCFSWSSRNRSLGEQLGAGRSLSEATEALRGRVAEGVTTSRGCCELCKKLGLDLRLMDLVERVLNGGAKPSEFLIGLLR